MDVKLINLNCFLLPKLLVNQDNASCVYQADRAAAIGRLIVESKFDVVCLEEVWGSNTALLHGPLTLASYQVPYRFQSWGINGPLGSVLDTVSAYAKGNGGLCFAAHRDAPIVFEVQHPYTESSTRSGKGFHLALLDVDKYWKGCHLLVATIHTDPGHSQAGQSAQLKQIQQVAATIRSTIQLLVSQFKISDTGKLAVVLSGDFNFSPTDTNYSELLREFSVGGSTALVDVALQYATENGLMHKYRSEETYSAQNSYVMWEGGRLDHIFVLDAVSFAGGAKQQLLRLKCSFNEIIVSPHGKELSDHYPIVAHLRPVDR